ncbi:MAG: ABC transporter substrate-binding protein [Opitutae bacterium]|nr:ABC transporter substrate-binding protein [Opitutae bacterium]
MSYPARHTLILRFAARLGGFAALLAWTGPAGGAENLEKVVLQLPYTHQFQFAGIYAAEAKGYFREAGLEVDVRPTTQQIHSALREVEEGRADFGISQGPQLIASRLAGQGPVVVAAIMQHSPQVLLTRAADNLNSPHDLIGRRVALDQTSLGSEIRLMLEREGVGFDHITIVPNEWSVNELTSGTADAMSAFVIDAPYIMAREGVAVRVIRPLDYGVDFYGDCLFTSERVLAATPDRVARMRAALLRGWAYALRHPDELIDWILEHHPAASAASRRSGLDREAMKYEAGQVSLLINADLVELGRINPGRWRRMGEGVNLYQPQGSLARLDGMLYEPPVPWAERFKDVVHWLLWGLAIAVAVAVLAVLANRRLQRLIARRTRELQEAQRRQYEIFDLAPAPIVVESYLALEPELERLRAEGVTDLRAHLRARPQLVRELHRLKRVIAANRLTLARNGFRSVEEMDRGLPAIMTEQGYVHFIEELAALWEGTDRLALETSYVNKAGETLHALLHWEVGRTPEGRRDLANVRLVFTEITALRKTEQALRENEARFRLFFEQSPLAIVEYDYAPALKWFRQLRQEGVTDLTAYLAADPAREEFALQQMPVVDINEAAVRLVGGRSKREVVENLARIYTDEIRRVRLGNIVHAWQGEYFSEGEFKIHRIDGSLRTMWYRWRLVRLGDGTADSSRTQTVMVDITEQRAAEQARLESEARYRELFDLSPVPLVEFDYQALGERFAELRAAGVTDLRAYLAGHPPEAAEMARLPPLTEVNQAALRAFGAENREALIAHVPRLFTEEFMASRVELVHELWENRESTEGEVTLRLLTGELRRFHYSWRMPLKDGRLTFRRSLTALVDITEQKNAVQALQESEDRYRRLFETTPNPMYIFDAETLRFVMVNEAAVERYGYTREEFAARTVLDIRPPDEAARLSTAMQEYRAHPAPPEDSFAAGVWRHCRKDGTIMLVEVFTHSLVFNGRTCVLVLPFDMTAKLAAEHALRESETRYRELFENAAGGVYRSTVAGRFLAVNPAMAQLLGCATVGELMDYANERALGTLYVQPRRREDFLAAVKATDRLDNFESEVRRRDGSTVWISENVRVVRAATGQVQYFEGFVADITARRRLEAEMTRASKLEAVGILAGGIAHDFNNILTVVLGNVTLAEMDTDPDTSLRHMLDDAKRATLRARDLTQQLLTFAKGGDPVRAAVALPELLRESAGFALHGAKARAEFALAPDLWAANADKGQVGQVVQNLVINSVQAMPQGGVVKITANNALLPAAGSGVPLPAGRYVHLTVADTGVGIAADHLAKIFDPYFTTKQQGSGLGLATVYSIVKKHQGHIEVESRLGEGTAFHIWIPAAHEAQAEPPVHPPVAASLRARVLFMDDEEPIRNMVGLFLRRLGVECEEAADGAEAVEKYRAAGAAGRRFDVVLMDLTVPGGMGGREALEHLKKLDPGVRAIVSSGYSRDPVLANYRAHGFCGILPKPYGLEQLRHVLREVLTPRPDEDRVS